MLAYCVLFYAAVTFCLPVPPSEEIGAMYPWWGTRLGIGNVQLQELLFLLWFLLYGWSFVPRVMLNSGIPLRQAAIWLVALAVSCGLASLFAPLVLMDLGRTFRLLLNAALMIAVVRWTRLSGVTPLGVLILGFVGGTIINLILSFRFPLIILDTMRLSGQNTAGVAMGVAVHLAAWLFLRTTSRLWRIVAVGSALLFLFGCALSYSRIGWFAGGLGLAAWGYVLLLARPRTRSERSRLTTIRLVLVPTLAVALAVVLTSPLGQEGIQWILTLADQKLNTETESDTNRWAYVLGTIEIMSRNPLGVGYSGFFDAMTSTDTYRSGMALEEVSVTDANPHASLLWYASAGGIPAAVMAVLLLVLLLNGMRRGLVDALGRPGWMLFALVAPPFLLISMTVPYIYNSIILIVPAAIAGAWGWAQRTESAVMATADGAQAISSSSANTTT
jgi:hypothetical protein